MKKVLWALEFFVFFAISFPLSLIPHSLIKKAGGALGTIAYLLWRKRRLIAIENLRTAIERNAVSVAEPPEEIIKEFFKNIGRSFIELLKVYWGRGNKIFGSVHIEGKENFDHAKAKGKGVIFITGHTGNWELMSISLSLKVDSIGVVARPINNPFLNRFVETSRTKYGNRVIYKKGGLKEMLQSLRQGKTIGLLIDQSVVHSEGVLIEFLGSPAWTLKVPALLARKTDSPVLAVFIKRTETGHVINISPEVSLSGDEIEDTKKLTGYVERYVKENPTEWLWIHRRWKRAYPVSSLLSL
ncbi:MAG: lysophospholipid acyltransferase family protein [Nitrospirae bacterium]|nr:lysophospholipid acyltransferase family protein [Nitrospirota bacterium]